MMGSGFESPRRLRERPANRAFSFSDAADEDAALVAQAFAIEPETARAMHS